MGSLRQLIAELVFVDNENARTSLPDDATSRTEAETRLINVVRRIAREEANSPVQVVDTLPSEAAPGSLWREKTTGNLYLGNGAGRPLSQFTPA